MRVLRDVALVKDVMKVFASSNAVMGVLQMSHSVLTTSAYLGA